jgi:hypothetical protein
MHELSSQAGVNGKGDADRSPGWRHNYSEIDWGILEAEGFERIGPGRIRKTYPVKRESSCEYPEMKSGGCCNGGVCECAPGHSGRTI